ncbi:unnamed protein product [Bathycoccus prasinos]
MKSKRILESKDEQIASPSLSLFQSNALMGCVDTFDSTSRSNILTVPSLYPAKIIGSLSFLALPTFTDQHSGETFVVTDGAKFTTGSDCFRLKSHTFTDPSRLPVTITFEC